MKFEDRPLVGVLEEFYKRQPVSFHVPGHKHGVLSGLPDAVRKALAYDVTELTGLDDLHEPSEAIKAAEERLSSLYHSERSFFLVNGSTVGNLAMLYATVNPGDVVLVQRNAHKSVFHAVELTGAKAVLLSPQWDEQTWTSGGVSLAEVREALSAYPQAKAAVFTNPSYYGIINRDMGDIIAYCHAKDIPVLVDEAHGAHFIVSEKFPRNALCLGADAVVQSAHKTLPAMTMASFLHVRSNLVKAEKIAHYLHMLQSSSPSYLLMASLDDARHYAETYSEKDYSSFQTYRQNLLEGLRQIPRLEVLEPDDPLKLIVRLEGQTGFALQKALEEEGVYSELADLSQVLLVLPLVKAGVSEEQLSIIEKFKTAAEMLHCYRRKEKQPAAIPSAVSPLVYTAGELHRMKTEWLPIECAIGRVAADAVIPYPPGIPLLIAGERITKEHAGQVRALLSAGSRFQGALNAINEIKVVLE